MSRTSRLLRGSLAGSGGGAFFTRGDLSARSRPLSSPPPPQDDGKAASAREDFVAAKSAPRRQRWAAAEAAARAALRDSVGNDEESTGRAGGEENGEGAQAPQRLTSSSSVTFTLQRRGWGSEGAWAHGEVVPKRGILSGVHGLAARLRGDTADTAPPVASPDYSPSPKHRDVRGTDWAQPMRRRTPLKNRTAPLSWADEAGATRHPQTTALALSEQEGYPQLLGKKPQPGDRAGVAMAEKDEEDDVVLDTPLALLSPEMHPDARPHHREQPLSFMEEVQLAKAKHAAGVVDTVDQPALMTSALARETGEGGDGDDEVVVDPYVEAKLAQHHHPSARGISQDVIDLVTDAFQETRRKEVARRRRALYELTHPNPADYTYGTKLVPPPPLNFGQVTPESVRLGEELMLDQHYSLVSQAGVRAEAKGSTSAGEGMLEVSLTGSKPTRRQSAAAAAAAAVVAPHRNRKREDNAFRDHNYFFEVNELYQEIVLVGKASAGKSSLINALLGQPDLAKTSSTPHTTRKINFYQSVTPEELQKFHEQQHHNQLVKLPGGGRQLTFVDMPGYGIEGMSDAWRDAAVELTDAYFGVRRSVNTVLFCIDCERGLTKTDVKYFTWLENVQGVFYVVLTKCDSVPHSRVCSVMRQIYVLITKNRKKYRKVFPYIIPVSARDGTNVDTLRGLITETSGMIPGDKLRGMLKQKKEALMAESLATEAVRLSQTREWEREQAKKQFLVAYQGKLQRDSPLLQLLPSSQRQKDRQAPADDGVRSAAKDVAKKVAGAGTCARDGGPPQPQHRTFELDMANATLCERDQREAAGHAQEDESSGEWPGSDGNGEGEAESARRRRRRERFLAWRRVNPLDRVPTPYGDIRYRLNTGLDNPLTDSIRLAYEDPHSPAPPAPDEGGEDVEGDERAASAAAAASVPTSRVMGLTPATTTPFSSAPAPGKVSQFLVTLEQFGERSRPESQRRRRRWQQAGTPRLLTEDCNGRLQASLGGRHVGPALAAVETDVTKRQAAFQARRLKELLVKANAEAPWDAVQTLVKRREHDKQQSLLSGMRRKEQAAYLRDAGRVTESFEKFEGEVTAAKYMNEVRQAKTVRSREQMHLNATAKISYRSMPTGLWRQYGQQDTHWPTPRVLGRQQDESHAGGAPQTPPPPPRRRRLSQPPSAASPHAKAASRHRKQRARPQQAATQ